MKRQLDFGDRVHGRVVDPLTFRATSPARFATGIVVQLFPKANRIVGIRYSNGETCTIRVSA